MAIQSLSVTDRFVRSHSFIGRVEPARQAQVGFELAGKLDRIVVDEGEKVGAGDVLATLDTARLDARRLELQAAVDVARAQLDLARSTRERIRDLSDKGHASSQRLDEADERHIAARASLALATARVDSLSTEIEKSVLHAPFDARVIRRHGDEGRVITAGVPLLVLQEERDPQARIGIPSRAASRVDLAGRYILTIGDHEYWARPRTVLPVTDTRTRTVDVLLDIEAAPGELRSGELAELVLPETVDAAGAWVPLDALTAGRRGTWVLYSINNTSRRAGGERAIPASNDVFQVDALAVELLAQDGERAYVRGALRTGDTVIVSGLNRVVPGQRVRPGPVAGVSPGSGS